MVCHVWDFSSRVPHLAVTVCIEGCGETDGFVWDLWLSGTDIPVIDCEFTPRWKLVFLIPP